jgi:hypothetical protein
MTDPAFMAAVAMACFALGVRRLVVAHRAYREGDEACGRFSTAASLYHLIVAGLLLFFAGLKLSP